MKKTKKTFAFRSQWRVEPEISCGTLNHEGYGPSANTIVNKGTEEALVTGPNSSFVCTIGSKLFKWLEKTGQPVTITIAKRARRKK